MRLLTAAVAAVLLLAAAGPASAATVSKEGGTVSYAAGAGDSNAPIFSVTGGELVVTDTAPLQAGAGCRQTPTGSQANVVRCDASGLLRVTAALGDQNDTTTLALPPAGPGATVQGGGGTDTVYHLGGPVNVSLDGAPNDGPGARGDDIEADVENVVAGDADGDVLSGSDAANRLDPGFGDDTVSAGGGNDFVDSRDFSDCESEGECPNPRLDRVACGTGFDTVDADRVDTVDADCEFVVRGNVVALTSGADRFTGFRPNLTVFGRAGDDRISGQGADTLEGNSGNDVLRAGNVSSSSVRGGSGNDTVVGGRGADYLAGGYGNDRISGRSGKDEINAGAGRDSISAGARNDFVVAKDRGAQRDRVSCGSGRDVAVVDRSDRVSRDCERRLRRMPRRR